MTSFVASRAHRQCALALPGHRLFLSTLVAPFLLGSTDFWRRDRRVLEVLVEVRLVVLFRADDGELVVLIVLVLPRFSGVEVVNELAGAPPNVQGVFDVVDARKSVCPRRCE